MQPDDQEHETAAGPVLTLAALLAKLDWPHAYAEHYVLSGCTGCGDSMDGWDFCPEGREIWGRR